MLSRSVMSNSFATPQTVAHQAPLSMGRSRQEYWRGLLCPPPGYLPDPGIELWSSAPQGVLYHQHHLGSHQRVICINPSLPGGLYAQCSPHNPDPPWLGGSKRAGRSPVHPRVGGWGWRVWESGLRARRGKEAFQPQGTLSSGQTRAGVAFFAMDHEG